MARVLLYNFSDDVRRKKVKALLFRLAVPSREIPPEEQDHPLGYLLGLDGYGATEKSGEAPFTGEMLVMHGLSSRQFQGLLDGMRQAGVYVPLKAAATPYNLSWSSLRLQRELQEEHRMMQDIKKQN